MVKKLGSSKLLNATFGYKVERRAFRRRDPFSHESPSNRWVTLVILLFLFLLVGIGRLADLQVIAGSYYRSLAEGNRIRRIPIKAPRGEILDRSGNPLARNVPVYKLATFTAGGVVEKTEDVTRKEALEIQSEDSEVSNRLLIDIGREYPLSEAAAHLVGYVNETTEIEINKPVGCSQGHLTKEYKLQTKYQLGDLVGRMGIEDQYDCVLRGINGEELIEVDARGSLVRRLGRREPIPGKSIKLAIDSSLQQTAYEALVAAPDEQGMGPRQEKGQIVRGALVVTNPENGEVLALVSVPSFNPGEIKNRYNEYSNDSNLPFFNRAIGGAFHPGSTYKLVTAAASIETGKLDRNFTFRDEGFIDLGGTKFRNWLYVKRGGTEGEINLARAITRSTDTFFYKAGEMVGIDALTRWSSAFGLGKKTDIDLPGEVIGLLPTPEWKLRAKGERWYLGNTYNMSIGQGDLTTTPLQVVTFTSSFANNGKVCVPQIAREIIPHSPLAQLKPENCTNLNLKEETLSVVREGMVGACSPGGTAGVFFDFTNIACKTGTAEFGKDETHAWFTAFAPSVTTDNATPIAVTALIEGGGEGSVVAAPVAKKIFEKWFPGN